MKHPILSLALVLMTPLISFADIGDLTREASDIRQRIVNFDATKPEQDRVRIAQVLQTYPVSKIRAGIRPKTATFGW